MSKEENCTELVFPKKDLTIFDAWKLANLETITSPKGHEAYRSYHPNTPRHKGLAFSVFVPEGRERDFLEELGHKIRPLEMKPVCLD